MKSKLDYTLTIDNRTLTPVADQIADQIKTLILTHQQTPELADSKFLSKTFDIDEVDIIKAFDILVQHQIFDYNHHTHEYFMTYNESTFVDDTKITSVIDNIKALNQQLMIKTFDQNLIPLSKSLKALGFDDDDTIYFQKRIYFGDTYPKAYMELYFSTKHLPSIKDPKYDEIPYYDIVKLNDPNSHTSYDLSLKTLIFDKTINQYLNQRSGSSGFLSEEYYYNDSKKLILYVNIYLNNNHFIKLQS